MKSHKKCQDSCAPKNTRPSIVARAAGGTYSVLRRVIHHLGDAEYMVCSGESKGEGVALFWAEPEARDYAEWQNGRAK